MNAGWIFGPIIGVAVGWTAKTVWDSRRRSNKILKKDSEIKIETVEVDLDKCDPKFKELCIRSYNKKNPDDAVEASIELARYVGVPEGKILHNMKEVDKFFLE